MLTDKVLQTIEKHNMLSSGDAVVIAVSGGMDSIVLLHVLNTLKDQLGITLHVAHLNHGIRGKVADDDAEFVKHVAENVNLPYSIEKADVPSLSREWKTGIEETARKVRYDFLNRVADRIDASKIATAHTANDQAETVLMNILRGTGIDGLGGISPARGRIIRPFIEVTRHEIENYQREHGLSYREDVTNVDTTYTRNRVRHDLLPVLREYNPKVDDAITRLSETAREDSDYLEQQATAAYAKHSAHHDDSISFPLADFRTLPKAIQRRLIRISVSNLMESLSDIGFIHVENLLAQINITGVYEVELPQGTTRVRKTDDTVTVYLIRPEAEAPKVTPRRLDIPGTVIISELELAVIAESLTGKVDWKRPRRSMDVVLDADKIEGILTVRTWLPGDRIVPLGMDQSKKLQDLFVDSKILKQERRRILIVADEEKILWVTGVTISQEAAITPATDMYLHLKVAESPLSACGKG